MKYNPELDKSYWEGASPLLGDIGIELELEGSFEKVPGTRGDWTMHNENSLRGGVEFVLKNPVAVTRLPDVLESLSSYLTARGTVYKRSIRTSTHIHINIRRLTHRQIYNVLAWYYMVEEYLVRSQGSMRIGNLFCLRLSDAEMIGSELVRGLRSGSFFSDCVQHSFKYGACNLATITKFGSLEFRFLRPIVDMRLLEMWCKELYNMVNTASRISIHDTISRSKRLSEREFMAQCFSQKFIDYLFNACPDHSKEWMLTNLDHIYEVATALDKASKGKYYFKDESDVDFDDPNPFGQSELPLMPGQHPPAHPQAAVNVVADELFVSMDEEEDWHDDEEPI